jgi:exodeoxyribonuclease VII small subunit
MAGPKRQDSGADAAEAGIAAMAFEDALAELESIVRGLEGGQLKLEDALRAYDRGALLRAHCERKLADAEARVAAIVERADGTLATRKTDLDDSAIPF